MQLGKSKHPKTQTKNTRQDADPPARFASHHPKDSKANSKRCKSQQDCSSLDAATPIYYLRDPAAKDNNSITHAARAKSRRVPFQTLSSIVVLDGQPKIQNRDYSSDEWAAD